MYERDAKGLLREMTAKNVMVEVCLTSNDVILGVTGKDHALAGYMKYAVPVALATDDQGVSRGNMTHEYVRAVQDQGLSYPELKKMARTSLEHSFLPGNTLTTQCADDAGSGSVSPSCKTALDVSEKAREQWKLEKAFAEFEKRVASNQ